MKKFLKSDGSRTVMASLLSILIGLLAGGVIIMLVGIFNSPALLAALKTAFKSIWDGVRLVCFGLFSTGRDVAGNLTFGFNPTSMGNLLFRATPLIMTGLSVALAYKTGLFNIGAPGQFLMGTMTSLFIALSVPSSSATAEFAAQMGFTGGLPAWLIWLMAFLGGMIAGALWGAIPGLLKALLNINEVLACIMTNWIAANLVTWAFDTSNLKNAIENSKLGYIYKTSFNGVETTKLGLDKLFPGSQVNAGILIAIIFAVLVYILMNKTTLGYELKACGANRFAARYAGIRDKRNIVLSMALAGALAGIGGALYYLAGNTEFFWSTYQSLPAVGFNGIPVALLASSNPIAVIFSGAFLSMLDINGQQLTALTGYNEYITDVIIAVIVYLSAFALLMKTLLAGRAKKAGAASSEPANEPVKLDKAGKEKVAE